ncbi:Leucine-rich repeat-containing protein 74A [Mactra antiquata]
MSRSIMSASSTSSAHFTGYKSTDTGQFRMRGKIRRISDKKITRQKLTEADVERSRDARDSSASSSDFSQDWDDFDDDEEDLIQLYHDLSNKETMAAAVGAIVTQTKKYNVNRPFSGIESDLIADVATNGTLAQKLYLRKCADFLLTPSKIFVKSLPTTVVNIGHQNIGPKGTEACAIALTKTKTVRVLNLDDNAIGHKGARMIALMLKENRLISDLSLADNDIGSRGLKYLVNAIMEIDKIKRLDLSNNGFQEKDADYLKQLLEETRNLQYLNLSHNEFREKGGELLGEALSYNDGLEELDISWNHLRRDGAMGLTEGLMVNIPIYMYDNTSLKKLTLSLNGCYLEGSLALQKTFQYNTTLEELDLTNNRINRECIEQLSHGLAKNTTLHTLVLKFNPLTIDGAHDILQFLADCPTSGIKLLDLGIQQVDPHCIALINEVHLQGRELKVIHGHVVGEMKSKCPELERNLIQEHPALVLIEFGKLMGFRLVDLFTSLDKDGSRTLDREEIHEGLKAANVPFSDECIEILIDKLDEDRDGEIDFSELLMAQKQHRNAVMKLHEAENSNGEIKVEDTALWKIRTRLMKLMAEKISDYSSFKRISDQIARQVKKKNDELEAKREAITRERARHPRKVRSRPASATNLFQQPNAAITLPKEDKISSDDSKDVTESDNSTKSMEAINVKEPEGLSLATSGSHETLKSKGSNITGTKDKQTVRQIRKRSVQLPMRMPYHTSAEDLIRRN